MLYSLSPVVIVTVVDWLVVIDGLMDSVAVVVATVVCWVVNVSGVMSRSSGKVLGTLSGVLRSFNVVLMSAGILMIVVRVGVGSTDLLGVGLGLLDLLWGAILVNDSSGGGGDLVDKIRLVDGVLIDMLVVLELLSLVLVVLGLVGGVFVMNRFISGVLVVDGDLGGVLVSDGSLGGVLVLHILMSIGLVSSELFVSSMNSRVRDVSNVLVMKRLNIFVNLGWVDMSSLVMRSSASLRDNSVGNRDDSSVRNNSGGTVDNCWVSLILVIGGLVLSLVVWVDGGMDGSVVDGEGVVRDSVLHLAAKEDLGESKTNGVTELIEVLVLPLSLSIHNLVVDILTIDNKVVLNVENEVPRISESLGHLTKLVEISANGGLALLELVGDIMDNMT